MVPAHLIKSLETDAEDAIRLALRNGAPGQPKPTDEPSFVASVVLGAVPDIAARWSKHLKPAGIGLDVTGLLCHGTPKVDFSAAGRPWSQPTVCRELGDLLVVHDHLSPGKSSRTAVLVQAKKSSSGVVRRPDQHQLHLYVSWPVFQSTFSTFPAGQRDFSNATSCGQMVDCGRYGIIHTRSPGGADWFVVPPAAPPLNVQAGITLGSYMTRMLDATAIGFGRRATQGGSDDWSKTVDDLLRITHPMSFTHTFGPLRGPGLGRSQVISGLRGLTATAFLISEFGLLEDGIEILNISGNIGGSGDEEMSGDGRFGIIHARTYSSDDARRE